MLLKNTTVRGPVKKQEFIFTTSISSFNPQREKSKPLAETPQYARSEISAVHRGNWEQPTELQRKRKGDDEREDRHQSKRYRDPDKRLEGLKNVVINRVSHRGSANCPAVNKNCNGCGERGSGNCIATCRK